MVNSRHEEYKIMFEVEEQLWWYRVLHEKVLNSIRQRFGENKEIKILDVGCGTGGLLLFLSKCGYSDIRGIDYSDSAIFFCQQRGVNVHKMRTDRIRDIFPVEEFDVIVCNDVLYSLENQEITDTLKSISSCLKSSGVFISNNNAFDIFYGTHDIAVGGKHRFTTTRFRKFLPPELFIKSAGYWSMILSPLILAVRISQQVQIKLGLINAETVASDVSLPPKAINSLFFKLVNMEQRLFQKAPFGSSLFLTLQKVRETNA